MVDFLLVLFKHFSPALTVESYERILVEIVVGGSLWSQVQGKGGSSTNDSWRQKTRVPGRCLRDPTFSRYDAIMACVRHTDRHKTTVNSCASVAPRGLFARGSTVIEFNCYVSVLCASVASNSVKIRFSTICYVPIILTAAFNSPNWSNFSGAIMPCPSTYRSKICLCICRMLKLLGYVVPHTLYRGSAEGLSSPRPPDWPPPDMFNPRILGCLNKHCSANRISAEKLRD